MDCSRASIRFHNGRCVCLPSSEAVVRAEEHDGVNGAFSSAPFLSRRGGLAASPMGA